MTHSCHARRCPVTVPPRMLMCPLHWRMVPKRLQRLVWDTYQPGQEQRKDPTMEYLAAAEAAIDAVWKKESQSASERLEGLLR